MSWYIDNGFRTSVVVCRAISIEEVRELGVSEDILLVKTLYHLTFKEQSCQSPKVSTLSFHGQRLASVNAEPDD